MRVVSLNCSNTEIVCALGCAGLLVGVDDHSDFPEDVVGRLPRVGPDLGIDAGKVAALKPDLVLASLTVPGHERVVASLERAGLPFLAPETITLEDVGADVRAIATRLGVAERGEALVASIWRALAEGSSRSGPGGEPRARSRILVEWWPKPVIVPGARSWVTELIEAAGGSNPFGDEPVKSRPVSDDEVIARDPDAVVICWCGVRPEKYRPDVVRARAAWRSTRALREDRVHCIPEAHLGRPGPRLVEGFRALRRIVESMP